MMPNLAIVEDFRPKVSGLPNIRAVVGELRGRHATDLVAALMRRIEQDPEVLESAAQFIVATLSYEDAARERRRTSMPTRQVRMRHHVERVTAARAIAATVKATVKTAVLDTSINGKQLRFFTGQEASRLGSGFSRLASRVPAGVLVGEVLTESQAAALVDMKAS
jgi:hypothetical protein